jgi:hypothetical protein
MRVRSRAHVERNTRQRIDKLFIRREALHVHGYVHAGLTGARRVGETLNAIFTPSALFADRFSRRGRILIALRARTIIRERRKRVRARGTERGAPMCVQNKHRHSNIFSLACVLIRALINARHDASHLSRAIPHRPLSPFAVRLRSPFIPRHPRAQPPSSGDQNSYLRS